MQEEIWKDVVGLEGIYQVSSEGRIKSVSRNVQYYNPLADRECVKAFTRKNNETSALKRILFSLFTSTVGQRCKNVIINSQDRS